MKLKVLTANRLTDGVAVWLAEGGLWQTSLQGARVAETAEEIETLEAVGKAATADNLVVDVNLIDVENLDGVLVPQRLRERIRADGPTINYLPVSGSVKSNAA